MPEHLPMVRIAGLYEKTSQKGNRYFIGRLGNARLLVFANTDKQQASDPDWLLFVQERSEPQPSTSQAQDNSAPDTGGIDGGDWPSRRQA